MSARRRPRRRRERRPLLWLLALALGALLFVIGVAVGEALHDNPRPGLTVTRMTTVAP